MKLIHVYPDSFVFEEPHRKVSGKNRLTISCHGNRERLIINGISYNPLQISLLIHGWTDLAKLHSIRVLSCRSANSDPNEYIQHLVVESIPPYSTSFASQLSVHLPNIFVRGYSWRLATTCNFPIVWNRYRTEGIQATADLLTQHFVIIKNNPRYHYHCVVFLNGRAVKQNYQTQTINGSDFACL
ncbi:hypothetical protein ID850_11535 [Xenorhabdus sp. Flor]|uniref:hypothetical protein n=1 Tax=Xenorhabdus cabanillasii TaxID=351673 RepID=UPI0019A7B36A|nr:hypothetical protein [Xenorhabdus sp. Flor]MBD2815389.1 hypothetical protein [Xenorhabdus sp. Flor]